MVNQPLDVLPGWAVYPLTVIVLLAALAGGYYYAKGRGAKAPAKSDRGVGAISGATLGLLAFLLAFVVGFGVNVWQERRVLVVSEANAISTTYLSGRIPRRALPHGVAQAVDRVRRPAGQLPDRRGRSGRGQGPFGGDPRGAVDAG